MRTIVDENQGRDIELFDGVRVSLDGENWFLVLPDASDPTLNVYAESATGDGADRLIDEVCGRIEQLVRN
jgi:mannose-1-phosphate guanylyltransferase/phosphomannomutase